MADDNKPYRMFSVRLATDDYLKLEEIRKILQDKAKNADLALGKAIGNFVKLESSLGQADLDLANMWLTQHNHFLNGIKTPM